MPSKLRQIVADNIKRYRLQAGITQAELAKKSKLTGVYISRIENSANNLTLDSIEQIAAALGVSPLQLFETGKAEPKFGKANIKTLKQAVRALDAYLDFIDQ